jgi:hypothetical protein
MPLTLKVAMRIKGSWYRLVTIFAESRGAQRSVELLFGARAAIPSMARQFSVFTCYVHHMPVNPQSAEVTDMNAASNIALLLAATRAVSLIICELAGILCICLGWKLYIKAIASSTEGEFSGPGFKIRLAAGGPGVFLCGLGIWLLLSVANRPFETTTTEPVASASASAGAPDPRAAGEAAVARPADFHLVAAPQAAPPAQKKPAEQSQTCLVRVITTRLDVGLRLTTADVEAAARNAAAGIRRAGAASIPDPEERAVTVRVLDQLASDAAKSDEKAKP